MSDCCTFQMTTELHQGLAKSASTPFVGIFPSAIDALVSVVQTVAGAIFALVIAPVLLLSKLLCRHSDFAQQAALSYVEAILHVSQGAASFVASCTNIVTLALLGGDSPRGA